MRRTTAHALTDSGRTFMSMRVLAPWLMPLVAGPAQPGRATAAFEAEVPVFGRSLADPAMPTKEA